MTPNDNKTKRRDQNAGGGSCSTNLLFRGMAQRRKGGYITYAQMNATTVPRLNVRMPIFLPQIDCSSKVNNTALAQVASIPRKTRTDRNIAAMVRPKRTTAVRLKYQKSCARLRRIISTT